MPSRKRKRVQLLITAVLVFLSAVLTADTHGHWGMPSDAPVDRLVVNAGAYVTEHPEDPQGHYVLGRIHGLAFTMKSNTVSVYDEERLRNGKPLPEVASDSFQRKSWWNDEQTEEAPTPEELRDHLQDAIKHLQKAIDLELADEKDQVRARYRLGLGYVIEMGSVYAAQIEIVPGITETELSDDQLTEIKALVSNLASSHESTRNRAIKKLRDQLPIAITIIHQHRGHESPLVREAVRSLLETYWIGQAIKRYYDAHMLAIDEHLAIKQKPLRGLRVLVGYEAGKSYLQLMRARGSKNDDEREQMKTVEDNIQALNDKPNNNAITPIIFSFEEPIPLDDLLAPNDPVRFDLDGDGRVEWWPWVKPTTGILVWDPDRRGKITSGRQLFGTSTWWMFLTDGYHALDLLDDNRDRRLSGEELVGLAIWFDANSNGVSEKGEVLPIEHFGVAEISTYSLTRVGESPANPFGLIMEDGRVLPTYDWVTAPCEDQSGGSNGPVSG